MAVTYFGFSSLGRSENLVDLKPLLPCTLTGLEEIKRTLHPFAPFLKTLQKQQDKVNYAVSEKENGVKVRQR